MNMFTGKEIRQIRLALGLSAAKFAKRLAVSENCVWKWESEDRHPTYSKMQALNKLAKEAGIQTVGAA